MPMMKERAFGPQKAAPRKLVINLSVQNGSEPIVRSCEINSRNFRNRTSFGDDAEISAVFVKAITDALNDCIRGIDGTHQVISLPEFLVEAEGLTLSGAHLMVNRTDDDKMNVVFRFLFFMGGINNAFKANIGFDNYVAEESDRLSALVLSDLSMPILNICEAIRSGLISDNGKYDELRDTLASSAHEISFHIELVKRFVERTESSYLAAQHAAKVQSGQQQPHLRLVSSSD